MSRSNYEINRNILLFWILQNKFGLLCDTAKLRIYVYKRETWLTWVILAKQDIQGKTVSSYESKSKRG